jgi:hypothetical protein
MTPWNFQSGLKRTLLAAASVLLLAMSSQKAQAYGFETHFYETETKLIFAGIHPAIAERLAAYAQWVDTSKMNSAMNPILGMHARVSRMMHFPTQGVSPLAALWTKLTKDENSAAHGDMKNATNVAVRDSMVANEIFNEALKTGNPYLMGAALHVLMDSYAHEGFNYITGHGDRGHWPDRPWMFVEKHNEMRKKLFHAITRIREVLPASALTDIVVNDQGKMNRTMNHDELYNAYINNPNIKAIDQSIPHRDPLYTGEAVRLIIDNMLKEGTATEALAPYVFENLRHLFFEKQKNGQIRDGYEIMREIIEHVYSLEPAKRAELINTNKVIEKYGNVPEAITLKGKNGKKVTIVAADILPQIDHQKMVAEMLRELCSKVIPKPALGDHDVEPGAKQSFETEHLYQGPEVKIQATKWQMARQKMFGLAPHTLDQTTTLVRLFKFFSQDTKNLFKDLDQMDDNIRKVRVTKGERRMFMWSLFKYIVLDYATYRLTWPLYKIGLLEKPMGNLRLTDEDMEGAKFWQFDNVFEKLREAGVFKQIYSEEQVEKLIQKWNQHEEKYVKNQQKSGIKEMSPQEKLDLRRETFFQRQSPVVLSPLRLSCARIYNR